MKGNLSKEHIFLTQSVWTNLQFFNLLSIKLGARIVFHKIYRA